ncbi:hypothetical protein SMKI_14G1310 [Saccharomyces mikatae IFO 1815]|uniref:Uncharacterized protein n=1 Tax=Saccharomyces mikatae IFO 1815 TaxID=226126 RepID=A0AA35IS56_SACMI|nr:uncharacterized protein SMKI_14G1310 [Saccharomyces mikatae IFO 1815]CAI4035922.1 hypothetical protein SMKI_14G1310 [Saccharomyces mikatae IFO 1815]
MNKVDQIIGFKKYEVKLPKDRQVTKNKLKSGNGNQIDTKREKENVKTFGEERKKFLEKMAKNKRKNPNKKDKEKSKEAEKDNCKRDDKKLKEQKKLPLIRDFRFKEPHSATIYQSAPVENTKAEPQPGLDFDMDQRPESKIMIDQAIQTSSPLNSQLSELFNDDIRNLSKDSIFPFQDTKFTSWERRWSNCSTTSNATTVSSIPDPKYHLSYNDLPSFNAVTPIAQDNIISAPSPGQDEGAKKLLQQEIKYSNMVKSVIFELEMLCMDESPASDTGITGQQESRWSVFPTCCDQTSS